MISAIIITKNEEKNIADCIASLSFCDEIVVVDADSSDATAQIARSHGASIITRAWQGYGDQKNAGIDATTGDWLLFLDADERISPELQEDIKRHIANAQHPVYWITIEDIFLGKRLRHLVGHNPRLVRKEAARWNKNPVHEQLLYTDTHNVVLYKDGRSGEITTPIIHHSHDSISSYLRKMHRYTSLDAEHMKEKGTHRSGREITNSPLLPYQLGIRQLVKLLFYRKGILDGWQGFVWCILSGYYEFEMGKKYRSL
jgi:glycosyltransferase involved in cell wall biosynthesis